MEARPTLHIVDDEPSFIQRLQTFAEELAIPWRLHVSEGEFRRQLKDSRVDVLAINVSLQDRPASISQPSAMPCPTIFLVPRPCALSNVTLANRRGCSAFVERCDDDRALRASLKLGIESALKLDRERDRHDRSQTIFRHFTSQEREVFTLVLEGLPNKVIAKRLGLSRRNGEYLRANIMKKAGVRSLAGLVMFSLKLNYPDSAIT